MSKLLIIFATTLLIFTASFKGALASGWWDIQSIDTMKQSRDLAREKKDNLEYESEIQRIVEKISKHGATHVAIGTPYDKEFIPYLKKWVKAARENNLKVWFRGNFSGWEGWFEYEKISKDDHKKLLENFILENSNLFEDGDLFTSCPECENGGPGDPRLTGDIEGHRKFLVDEYKITKKLFVNIKKDVRSNLYSMNYDVASLIMDPSTTFSLDGVVTIDHYVSSPEKLNQDITKIAEYSKGKIILGEFGAPIPDIHGAMSQEEQKDWVESALAYVVANKYVIGANYWVAKGGSSALWGDDFVDRAVVSAITKIFIPKLVEGVVMDDLGSPIGGVLVRMGSKEVVSDSYGKFKIPYTKKTQILFDHKDYLSVEQIPNSGTMSIRMERKHENILYKIRKLLKVVFERLSSK